MFYTFYVFRYMDCGNIVTTHKCPSGYFANFFAGRGTGGDINLGIGAGAYSRNRAVV